MNCKPGDLAVVVRSTAGNEGKLLQCIRYLGCVDGFIGNDYWEVDRRVPTLCGFHEPYMRDSYLRPIRPGDISDEEVRDLYAPKIPEAA